MPNFTPQIVTDPVCAAATSFGLRDHETGEAAPEASRRAARVE
jgi:hypothetical protein